MIRVVKDVAPTLFVNARVDTHWLGIEPDATVERARRYVDAGADGIFVPGLGEPAGIEAVVAAVPVPLNVLPQLDIATLTDLGVRRISTGSLPFRAAVRAAVDTAVAVRDGATPPPADTYDAIEARTA